MTRTHLRHRLAPGPSRRNNLHLTTNITQLPPHLCALTDAHSRISHLLSTWIPIVSPIHLRPDLPAPLYVPYLSSSCMCQGRHRLPVFRFAHTTSPTQRIKKEPSRRPRPPEGSPEVAEPAAAAFLTRCSFRAGLFAPSKTLRRRLAAQRGDAMITVGNKKHGAKGICVGRPSPLGNPFTMQGEATGTTVIHDYKD
jgi:hypothetical protein